MIVQLASIVVSAGVLSVGALKYMPFPFVWILFVLIATVLVVFRLSRNRWMRIVLTNAIGMLVVLLCFEVMFLIVPAGSTEEHGSYIGSYTNSYFRTMDFLGYGPEPDMVCTSKLVRGTSCVYEVTYTIDRFGHRRVPDPAETNASAIVFFGDSFTFGEGVDDEECLPYQVFSLTQGRYRVVNLGFHGYGPHQMLVALENNIGESSLNGCVPRYVFYQHISDHARRVAGKSEWEVVGPRYTLTEDGSRVRYVGQGNWSNMPCEEGNLRTWVNWQIAKSSIGRRVVNLKRKMSRRDVDLLIGVVQCAEKKVKEKWPNARFVVLTWEQKSMDQYSASCVLSRKGVDVIYISDILPAFEERRNTLTIRLDGHPNRQCYSEIAAYLVNKVLKE